MKTNVQIEPLKKPELGVVVPINYILIVFYFPAFIILHETTVHKYEAAVVNCLCRTAKCVYCRRCYKKGKRMLKDRKRASRSKRKHEGEEEGGDSKRKDGGQESQSGVNSGGAGASKKIVAVNEPLEILVELTPESQLEMAKNLRPAKDSQTAGLALEMQDNSSLRVLALEQDQNCEI